MAKSTGRGRPSLFRGAMAKAVAGILKANGLKGGKEILAQMGTASLPTLQKLAKEHGVEFGRGRPATGKAKPKAAKSTGKRGRPVGSKNKPKTDAPVVKATGGKRGRPLGSKNKPKVTEAPVVAQVVDTPVVETPVVPVVETPAPAPVVETPVAPVEAPETVPAPAPVVSAVAA